MTFSLLLLCVVSLFASSLGQNDEIFCNYINKMQKYCSVDQQNTTKIIHGRTGKAGPRGRPGRNPVIDYELINTKILTAVEETTRQNAAKQEEKIHQLQNAIEVLETNILTLINWHKASNGMFYKVFHTTVNYDTAKKNCVKEGATLASKTIRDPNSFREIQTLLKRGNGNTWIGLDDIKTEGSWVWTDGERAGINGLDWSNRQRDNSAGKEDCIHFWDRAGMKLNDANCNTMMKYICEKSI